MWEHQGLLEERGTVRRIEEHGREMELWEEQRLTGMTEIVGMARDYGGKGNWDRQDHSRENCRRNKALWGKWNYGKDKGSWAIQELWERQGFMGGKGNSPKDRIMGDNWNCGI